MTRCLSIREKFDNNKVCVLGNLSASMERFVLYKLFFFNVEINLWLIIKVEKLSHGLTSGQSFTIRGRTCTRSC